MIKSSLIVPTYNGKKRILNFLRSLLIQTKLPDEVIVVVDGSTDDTIASINNEDFSRLPLKVHYQQNKGRPAARNAGLKLASNELIISFDDDMVLTPQVIEKHLQHQSENPGTVCVGYQAERKPEPGNQNFIFLDFRYYLSNRWNTQAAHYPDPMTIYNYQLTTANCSFPKSVIDQVGYFDEKFKEVEDFDLGTRMMRSGIKMYYRPDILAWHDNPDWDFKKFVQRQVQYRRDDLAWLKKMEAAGMLDKDFIRHPRYTVGKKYPFHKQLLMKMLAHTFWIDLAEKKYFAVLPKSFRYKFMDVVNAAHTSLLKSPK